MKKRLAKAATVIMIMTLINKAIGFLRDALVGSAFGTTYQTDAYNIAMNVSDFLFIMIALAITTTFIPILSDTLNKKGKEEMFDFANNIMNITTLLGIILIILGVIFSPAIVKIMALNADSKTFNLAVNLTRISVVTLVFLIMHSGYTAILQTMDDFLGPTVVGLIFNIPVIVYILFGASGGVYGLTIATVIGAALRALAQIPFLYKHGFRFKPILNLRDKRIKKMLMLILPVIIGASANQINKLVDQTLASGIANGGISALVYGQRVSDVIYATFAVAIITVIFPTMSMAISEDDGAKFKFYMEKGINNMNMILFPCTIGLIVLSTPIITVIFKHGIFDDRSVEMTASALAYYAIGIPFFGLRDIFNKSLYAAQDTKKSTINGIIAVIINIILSLLFIEKLGLKGLALSTSLAAIVATILLFGSVKQKIKNIETKPIFKPTLKIFIASLIMGAIVKLSYDFMYEINMLLAIGISIIIGVVIYGLLLKVFKVSEFEEIIIYIKSKIKS
ncbi:murein biosynthesis integral membrane protein MurJ [Clostridium sp. CTA-19]